MLDLNVSVGVNAEYSMIIQVAVQTETYVEAADIAIRYVRSLMPSIDPHNFMILGIK